jgi:hypothetical protein
MLRLDDNFKFHRLCCSISIYYPSISMRSAVTDSVLGRRQGRYDTGTKQFRDLRFVISRVNA